MTTPISTPDAQPPITDPPASMVEGLRQVMPLMDKLIAMDESKDLPEARALTSGSADFLRQLFPHLDDLTLAAFCGYVATNLSVLVKDDVICPDSFRVAIVYADLAKTLAWSLGTPEIPEQP